MLHLILHDSRSSSKAPGRQAYELPPGSIGSSGPADPPEDIMDEQMLLERLLESMGKESLSEKTLDAVLRVYCTHVQPSFAAPWQRLQQISSTSSGFVIDGRRIITNAHSVEYGKSDGLTDEGERSFVHDTLSPSSPPLSLPSSSHSKTLTPTLYYRYNRLHHPDP